MRKMDEEKILVSLTISDECAIQLTKDESQFTRYRWTVSVIYCGEVRGEQSFLTAEEAITDFGKLLAKLAEYDSI